MLLLQTVLDIYASNIAKQIMCILYLVVFNIPFVTTTMQRSSNGNVWTLKQWQFSPNGLSNIRVFFRSVREACEIFVKFRMLSKCIPMFMNDVCEAIIFRMAWRHNQYLLNLFFLVLKLTSAYRLITCKSLLDPDHCSCYCIIAGIWSSSSDWFHFMSASSVNLNQEIKNMFFYIALKYIDIWVCQSIG